MIVVPETIKKIAYQFDLGHVADMHVLEDGLINNSYKITTPKGIFVVQELSSLWDKRVIQDYTAVQSYLRTQGVQVPVLLSDRDNKSFYNYENKLWRSFEYIPHDGVQGASPAIAYEAGKLLGKFHACMSKSSFKPTFALPHYHDTRHVLDTLNSIVQNPVYASKVKAAQEELWTIQNNITKHYLPHTNAAIVIHGDPKLLNFLFRDGKAVALLDLDTMMSADPLIDLGDALRSWCRIKPSTSTYDHAVFLSALKGYRGCAPFSYTDAQVKNAMGLITLEIAARYYADYLQESYFGFNPKKYATRSEQNITRCRRYLQYYKNSMEVQ